MVCPRNISVDTLHKGDNDDDDDDDDNNNNNNNNILIIHVSNFHNYFNKSLSKTESFE